MKKATIIIALVTLMQLPSLAQDLTLTEVLVGNEGNFTAGNATITHYDFETQTAVDGVFFNANGVGLGDVVQSITEIDDKLYIVVNNSQKIVIADPESFNQIGQITFGAGASPREIIAVGNDKAYVTDLFGNYINVVDLASNSITSDTIRVGNNPDKMFNHGDHVFVSNNGFGADSTIFKIDIATHAIVDTIVVHRGPAGMVEGAQNSIWVVSRGYSGDYDSDYNLIPGTSLPGGLTNFNTETGEVISTLELSSAGEDIGITKDFNEIFVNSGGIQKIDASDMQIPNETLVEGNFYSFNFDAVGNRIFTANAKSFSSAGEIEYFDTTGSLLGAFDTGIIPGDIFFTYEVATTAHTESIDNVENFRLSQNYPNPFNPSTNIEFSTPKNGRVSLNVYSITGQHIATLVDGHLSSGVHSVAFNASNLASGLYVYQLWNGETMLTKTMTLIK